MTRDKQFDLLESLNNLDDDILIAYTASRASRTAGASGTAGQRTKTTREQNSSPWVLAACLCLFAALVYVAILMTAGGGWDRIATRFGWETSHGTEYETGTVPDPEETTDESRTQAETKQEISVSTARADFFPPDAPEDHMDMQITYPGTMLVNDAYIILCQSTGACSLTKINRSTGERSPVCCDPYCAHGGALIVADPDETCPFNFIRSIHFLYGNKLYYTRSYIVRTDTDGAAEYHDVLSSYDLMTGEYKAIENKKIPYNTYTMNGTPEHESFQNIGEFIVYGSYAYSFQYRPINGDGDKLEDYSLALVRLDLTTDKSEDVMAVDNLIPYDATPCAIRNGIMYFLTSDAIWSWNPAEGAPRQIMSYDPACTTWYRQWNNAIHDGYWYTLIAYYADGINNHQPTSAPVKSLVRINLETGEEEKLTEAGVEMLFISEDSLYMVLDFGPFQKNEAWRAATLPWYEEHEDIHVKFMRAVVRMDVDGGHEELIGWSNIPYTTVLLKNGLVLDDGFFEFSTGITYNTDGTVRDDPKNGIFAGTNTSGISESHPKEDYDWHFSLNP